MRYTLTSFAPALRSPSFPLFLMASFPRNSFAVLTFFLLFSSAVTYGSEFERGKDKKTHLHFYFHDILSGPRPTAVKVAPAGSGSTKPAFGDIFVMDDPLTKGPKLSSEPVGRAQGMYVFTSQSSTGVALLEPMNFVFTGGKFNGSTLALLGHNEIFAPTRELPVVGGTGAFRLARGYAIARTYVFNTTSGNAIVEYNVYVLHH